MGKRNLVLCMYAAGGLLVPVAYFLTALWQPMPSVVFDALWPTKALGLLEYSFGKATAVAASFLGNAVVYCLIGAVVSLRASKQWQLMISLVGSILLVSPLWLLEGTFGVKESLVAFVYLSLLVSVTSWFGSRVGRT